MNNTMDINNVMEVITVIKTMIGNKGNDKAGVILTKNILEICRGEC